jgi:mono/diheme cytochrome c family protein
VPGLFPPLKGDQVAQQADPTTVVRLILDGGRAATTQARPTPFSMPAFGWKLDDAQVAAVATYVRGAWGNSAPAVSADKVKELRETVKEAGE